MVLRKERVLRWNKDAWLDLGTTLLRERGPHALTLDALTEAAGRTRGSFYHHFRDRDVFLAALVARWRHVTLDARAAALPPNVEPSNLRAFLREEPFRLDHSFERALRHLAAVEPTVRVAVDEVDRARIDALSMLVAMLRPELKDPASHAFVQYAAMVGSQWLAVEDNDPRMDGIKAAAYRLFELDEE